MTDDKVHAWVYVIIPLDRYTRNHPENDTLALFTAFCKDCRNYFSEEIQYSNHGKALMQKSNLPKYGCVPDDEFKPGVGFSTLPEV